jgi:adenylate kinase family enzyme
LAARFVMPMRMQRIAVIGTTGSGKTTLARDLAATLGLVHIELDSLFHQADWQPLEREEFRRRLLARMAAADAGWVVCGNYTASAGDLVRSRVDTIVWLDLPRALVMWRVTARTLRRVAVREVLWNGNREPWSNLYAWDPEKNIIRWAWVTYPKNKHEYAELFAKPPPGVSMVRLRSPAAVRGCLTIARRTLARPGNGGHESTPRDHGSPSRAS